MKTKQKDKRKLLLVLPLIIIPFLALAFYALGGGQESKHQNIIHKGINTVLPDATFKEDDPENKLGFYQRADKDSSDNKNGIEDVAQRLGFQSLDTEPSTEQINQKLAEINREINNPAEPYRSRARSTSVPNMKVDVDRLETLMKTMQENNTEDPEMAQINGMLQNILDIQHPQRIQDRYEQRLRTNRDSQFRAIRAIIVENQKVVQGATIKLQLQDTVMLNGQLIPKGHFVFGTCRITNQRLLLDVTNIRLGSSIIPVDLTVYSLDGMAGIEAPEALLNNAVNSGADDAVRGVSLYGFDQSVATQVAGAGLDAAKSLFSKKVKQIKVKLKAGQPILLRNNKHSIR